MLKTSYFNSSLFIKNVTRFWPLWVIYTVVWIIALPIQILNKAAYDYTYSISYSNAYTTVTQIINRYDEFVLDTAGGITVVFTLIFAVLFAMAVFSYQFGDKSATMMHSLPIKREGLFITNYLSGLSFIIVPHLLIFLLSVGCEVAVGYVNMRVLATWLWTSCAMGVFFFSFASFCAQFTGSLLALPVFYAILNFLSIGFWWLFSYMANWLIFGSNMPNSDIFCILSPAVYMLQNVQSSEAATVLTNAHMVIVYGIVGLVFAAAALLIYRRHRVEGAGELVTVAPARPIFKIGFSVCFAFLMTIICKYFFGLNIPKSGDWEIATAMMLLWGAFGYFAADMALKKSFRVFDKKQKGIFVSAAVILLVMLGIRFDVLALGSYIPAADTMNTVYFNGYETSDREEIEEIIELNREIIKNSELLDRDGTDGSSSRFVFNYFADDENINRYYNITLSNEQSKQLAEELTQKADNFVNTPERIMKINFGGDFDISQVVGASMDINVYSETTGAYEYSSVTFYGDDISNLANAVVDDIYNGTMGRREYFYYDSMEGIVTTMAVRASYDADISDILQKSRVTTESIENLTLNIMVTLSMFDYYTDPETGELRPTTNYVSFGVTPENKYTFEFLEKYSEAVVNNTVELR